MILLHLLTLFVERLLFLIDVQNEHTQQLPHILVVLNNKALTDETQPVNEKQINDFLGGPFDCPERHKFNRLSFTRVDDCSTNPHDVETKKFARICLSELKQLRSELTKATSHKNNNSNLWKQRKHHDRQICFQNIILENLAVSRKAVRFMSAIFWNVQGQILTNLSNLLKLLLSQAI